MNKQNVQTKEIDDEELSRYEAEEYEELTEDMNYETARDNNESDWDFGEI